jgi:hypothetical protein
MIVGNGITSRYVNFAYHSKQICAIGLTGTGGQARDGMWGMPGHREAMKAVVSCDKLGGVAHTR